MNRTLALLAALTLAAPAALHAQTEVQVGGLWARNLASGGYIGVLHDKLVGSVRTDTTLVDGIPIPTRVGRIWTVTAWLGGGLVDGPGSNGIEAAIHGQLGFTRRRPSSVVDRVGLMADVFAPRWGVGASGTVRLKAAFWLHGGVVRARGAFRPVVGLRIQASIIAELMRFME